MSAPSNICGGPFGAVYDFYIERPWLARLLLKAMWGVDPRSFYASLGAVADLPDGAVVLDAPCGGGVALRGLRPGQVARWVGVDIEPAMLRRAQKRAAAHRAGLTGEWLLGDLCDLPVADGAADLCLSYGGLHCVGAPDRALAEMARCLRPGGLLIGSTFLAQGSRRQRLLLRNEDFGSVGSARDLRARLESAGITEVAVDRDDGLAVFSGRR